MSIRENIQVFHHFDPDEYLEILSSEYNVQPHPSQKSAFIIDDVPFYAPNIREDHVFILGFNMVPLSPALIQVLVNHVNHPELVPRNTLVLWTQEQDLIFEGEVALESSYFAGDVEEK